MEARRDARQRLGIPPDVFLVGSFGHASFTKRIEIVIEAVAQVVRDIPSMRYVIVGKVHPPNPPWFPDLREVARRTGVGDQVIFTDLVSLDDFQRWIDAVDVAVNLRYPTSGETSGALIRLLVRGVPCIISAVDQFLDFPDECCWKVEPTGGEIRLVAAYLRELATQPHLRRAMGSAAQLYVRRNHDPARSVEAYLDFLTVTPSVG